MDKGFVVWFTGLSASGKSTLAYNMAEILKKRGTPVEVLDGDEVRETISKDLGFSAADRQEHARRVIGLSKILVRNGVAVLVPLISPYKVSREAARAEFDSFIEVYVNCPIEACIERDPKGLYAKALSGEIKEFTGVSDPYEPPDASEVVVNTNELSVEECCEQIMEAVDRMLDSVSAGARDIPTSRRRANQTPVAEAG
ncbi:MAG: adenylyl-sulfate kinase [Dehalococcoidia bacterium]